MNLRPRHQHSRRCAGLALVEAVLSSIVIGLMFIAALRLVVASRTGQTSIEVGLVAAHLAEELMAEIMGKPYEDPDGLVVLGIELAENDFAARSAYDDVDDYNGLLESPPRNADGAPMTHLPNFARHVRVEYAAAGTPSADSILDTGVKRIIITITHHGVPVRRLSALRTRAADR